MAEVKREPGEPYCGECGYTLTGATDSSKCPECGRPLVDVLMRPMLDVGTGKRFRSKARIFGMPVIDIAIGASGTEPRGRAKGFIAIGNIATGVLAIGGHARGVVAVGGLATGGFSMGGMSLGLFTSVGGMSFGGIAVGGWATGALACGGGAIGWMAQGGMAFGWFARAGGAFGKYTMSPAGQDAAAQRAFDAMSWFFGAWPPTVWSFGRTFAGTLAFTLALAGLIALLAIRAYGRSGDAAERFVP